MLYAPTDTPHTSESSIPTPSSYPLYKYPAYTLTGGMRITSSRKK